MSWLLLPIMAVLNRIRGGGFGGQYLPGHPRFYVSLAVAGLDLWSGGSGAMGLVYLIWSLLPWGHLMCLGRWAPARPISTLEEECLAMTRGNPWVAFGLLHVIGLVPAMFVSPVAFLMAPAIVAIYELFWRSPADKSSVQWPEMGVGVLWGLAIYLQYPWFSRSVVAELFGMVMG